MKYDVVSIEKLRPLEKVFPRHLKNLEEMIDRDGFILKPITAQAVGRKRHITILFYDSGSTYDFHPNVFSLIDFDKKLEILKCYKSQIDRASINIDIVKKKNAYWASLITEIPTAYAEGFVARKMRYDMFF
jgi:hypothetical protein